MTGALLPFLKEKGFIADNFDRQRLENIVKLYQPRLSTLVDFLDWTDYLFLDKVTISAEDKKKYLTTDKKEWFHLLGEKLSGLSDYGVATAEEVFRAVVAQLGIKAGDLVHHVRVALTGKSVGPGLFETMAVLGKEKTIQRLQESFN